MESTDFDDVHVMINKYNYACNKEDYLFDVVKRVRENGEKSLDFGFGDGRYITFEGESIEKILSTMVSCARNDRMRAHSAVRGCCAHMLQDHGYTVIPYNA